LVRVSGELRAYHAESAEGRNRRNPNISRNGRTDTGRRVTAGTKLTQGAAMPGSRFVDDGDGADFSQCCFCSRALPENRCQAYPGGVPDGINTNNLDHRKPQPDDNGMQFVAALDRHGDALQHPLDTPTAHERRRRGVSTGMPR